MKDQKVIHTFKIGDRYYKIVSAKGTYRFTLLKGSNPVDDICGMTSTCFESPRLRFVSKDPLWEYAPGDRIAMEDAITFLQDKYNHQN